MDKGRTKPITEYKSEPAYLYEKACQGCRCYHNSSQIQMSTNLKLVFNKSSTPCEALDTYLAIFKEVGTLSQTALLR